MTKKAIKAEDIIDAIQDPKITETLMKNLTHLITPIVEIVVAKMSASLSEAFEKMVDQKISTNQETIIASCDTKLSQAQDSGDYHKGLYRKNNTPRGRIGEIHC